DAALFPVSGSLGAREPGIRRAPLWHAGSARHRAGHDQPARTFGTRGPACRRTLRRLEATACAWGLHAAQSAIAAVGRADRRRRPEGAARFLERNTRVGGAWTDRAGLDPLHGRGRALSRDRLYRLRPSAGAR